MKRTITLIVVLLLLVVGVIAEIKFNDSRHHAQEIAISAVFANHHATVQNSYVLVRAGDTEHRKLSPRMLLGHLKAIKTDGCPENFRLAWLRYIQTCDRFIVPSPVQRQEDTQIRRAISGSLHIGPGIGVELDNRLSAMAMAKRLIDRDCQEAWHKCEAVALRDGVQDY
jgi:hypothetical protein